MALYQNVLEAITMTTVKNTDELLTRRQAARYLQIEPQTLAVWATAGRYGLPMIKVGRAVRYRRADLDAWLASRTRTSTA